MKVNKQVFIVIAAYNEEKNISKVIQGLKKAGYQNIIVVDDCSKDRTYELAEAQNIHVLKHVINRGQGAALRTGIEYALSLGADAVVTFDADGQHRLEDLPAMLKPVLEGEVDVTLGSRFLKQTEVPPMRKFLLKGSIIVQNLFYGIKLTDANNGFRVLSRKA
ncbi:glycosyltransferase family 2 protein, partial [Candidatus Woesearchaeota archaeon]|nr:glycosyltransferase family 2 protein [Candidatus Woesearchaeota archaeon]